MTFSGLAINGNQRIGLWSSGGGGVKFEDGGSWQCATASPSWNTASPTAQLLAINYTGGCLLGTGPSSIRDQVAATYYASTDATPSSSNPQQGVLVSTQTGAARVPMTQGITQYRDQGNRLWNITIPASYYNLLDPASPGAVPVAPVVADDVMTFSYCANKQALAPMAPGVILEHFSSATVFVVTSVGSPTTNASCHPATAVAVTTRQQNNLNVVPGTNTFASNNITSSTLASGIIGWSFGPLVTLPTRLYFGSFTSGGATVSNVNDATGSASSLAGYLSVGDFFLDAGASTGYGAYSTYGANTLSWPIPAGGVTLSAVTNGNPGSIVMNAPAQSTGIFPLFPFELRP